MQRIADYIMSKLVEYGVNHVFMITGRGMLYLSDAAAKNEQIEGISVHHEQSGAFAAYAYAKRKKTYGACLVSTGVASTNAITGVLNAWQDDVPVVFISGQNMLRETTYHTGLNIRTYGQQEANIIELVKPVTKYAVMLENAENAAYEVDKAFYMANEGRKGPVWIDVPLDVQNMRIEPAEVRHFTSEYEATGAADHDLEYVVKSFSEAERPVMLIGSGVSTANAEAELRELAETVHIPVVFDTAAVDIYPDERKYSIGSFGSMGGTRAGNFAVQNSDFVLSVGCRLNSMQVGEEPERFARAARIVAVDIDENEPKKETVKLDKFIKADAKQFLRGLLEYKLKQVNDRWIEKCLHWKSVFPKCEAWSKQQEKVDLYNLADVIGKNVKPGQTVIADAGLEELITPSVAVQKDGVRCIHPSSQGCMGFALGAMIGAYYAGDKSPVAVIGDGSVMMNIQELQTISFRKVPAKIFIANNNCYAVIRKRQKDMFRKRTIGTDSDNGVGCADFKKIAAAFDIPYVKIESTAELNDKVQGVLADEGAVICEVMTPEDQIYLRDSFTRNEKRKFVKRTLEDQEPFLNRELFRAEMVIDPIPE